MGTTGIDMTWIVVSDLEKAIKYYRDVIGLKLLEKSPQFGWAELQGKSGGARLGLAQTSGRMTLLPGANGVFAVTVDNIEQAKKESLKGGSTPVGDIMEVPGHVKLLLCKDPDGNHFQLAEKLNEPEEM